MAGGVQFRSRASLRTIAVNSLRSSFGSEIRTVEGKGAAQAALCDNHHSREGPGWTRTSRFSKTILCSASMSSVDNLLATSSKASIVLLPTANSTPKWQHIVSALSCQLQGCTQGLRTFPNFPTLRSKKQADPMAGSPHGPDRSKSLRLCDAESLQEPATPRISIVGH